MQPLSSIPGIADVERLDGPDADPAAPPDLLVEIPHGADRRAHYDGLRAQLASDLPADLHVFFHVNTDTGAYEYGRRVAERVISVAPARSALIVRCLIPRTFVDTNRVEDAKDELGKTGLTAGVAPYVRHPDDIALLLDLHRRYVALAEHAYELVCGSGGFAISPHTYGPRTMGIAKIDDDIVNELRRAHEPEAWAKWPVRPEVDMITKTADGVRHAPERIVEALINTYRAMDVQASENVTYFIHPATQGARWALRFPDRFLTLEVRRDLLVEDYTPFDEMKVRPAAADRFAAPIAGAIDHWLRQR